MKKGVWVLTYECNDYDQHGQYFEAVFSEKPSVKDLAKYFSGSSVVSGDAMSALGFIENLLDGGGRIGQEYTWYNLDFVEFSNV